MHAKAILSSKGQVVIPKALRNSLGIHSGTEISINIRNNIIELTPIKTDLKSFFGQGKRSLQNKDINSVDELIAKAVIENDRH